MTVTKMDSIHFIFINADWRRLRESLRSDAYGFSNTAIAMVTANGSQMVVGLAEDFTKASVAISEQWPGTEAKHPFKSHWQMPNKTP